MPPEKSCTQILSLAWSPRPAAFATNLDGAVSARHPRFPDLRNTLGVCGNERIDGSIDMEVEALLHRQRQEAPHREVRVCLWRQVNALYGKVDFDAVAARGNLIAVLRDVERNRLANPRLWRPDIACKPIQDSHPSRPIRFG